MKETLGKAKTICELLLLPKSFNASYGDLPYVNEAAPDKGKLLHYNTQNLLARSLHPLCYQNNPGFLKFIERTGLASRSMETFRSAEMEERSQLYQQLAEHIWNPERIKEVASV